MPTTKDPIKGVNLGGWLVLEKWITPNLFKDTDAEDEYTLSQTPGSKKLIDDHRRSFITAADFKWLADNGFKFVRLPIGFWILGGQKPFLKGTKYLDFAFAQAEANKLKVLLDIHGVPGSQNGEQHSGRAGEVLWHSEEENINTSLEFLANVCNRYGRRKALWSIGVLNEPSPKIPLSILCDYYIRAINIIAQLCDKKVAPILSDSFRPKEMVKALRQREVDKIILDMHFYQTYSFVDRLLGFHSTLWLVKFWGRKIQKTQKYYPVIIGEWSGGLGISSSLLGRDGKLKVTRKFMAAQQQEYDETKGWFYWNYKVDTNEELNPWDLRQVVKLGLIKK